MKLILNKKPNAPTIIEGFPGMGFVGTIAIEYLIDKLETESIGQLWSPKIPPVAMIYNTEVRSLLEIRYSKKHNLVLLHAVAGVKGLEWDLADTILELAKKLKAKDVISLEGVAAPASRQGETAFYYSTNAVKSRKLKTTGALPLTTGAIMGVSGALMTRVPKNLPASFIFGATHTGLPDSGAAANIIRVLTNYIGLKVDYKPLLKEAEKFESRLKDIVKKSEEAKKQKEKKEISYLG